METSGTLFTAFLVGLLGGVHCVGMCSGIVGALTAGVARPLHRHPARLLPYQLGYNAGRILGYTIAGALMGGLGVAFAQALPLQHGQRILYGLAALFMILLGLYLADWWRVLTRLERFGTRLWRYLEPLGRRLLPVATPVQAFGLGLIWAWLPCGLVYSVLVWAIASGSPLRGALLMFVFGLGTLPNLLGMGLLAGAAARLSERPIVRRAAGLTVIGFGVLALARLWPP